MASGAPNYWRSFDHAHRGRVCSYWRGCGEPPLPTGLYCQVHRARVEQIGEELRNGGRVFGPPPLPGERPRD